MIVANKCIPRPVASRKIKLLTTLWSIPNSLFNNSCFTDKLYVSTVCTSSRIICGDGVYVAPKEYKS